MVTPTIRELARLTQEISMIKKLDFVGVPTQDSERARTFYVETLGLQPDQSSRFEVWLGGTCFAIWEPEQLGMEFAPQNNGHLALHVDDVEKARAELEAKGVVFAGDTFDTGVCHMALFTDPDGNDLMLHHRYAPHE
jgi:catechol 2,3-dioxygenase-like lactoylglutathione lyase family enzyme